MLLSLPVFSPDVPACLALRPASADLLRFALAMTRMGLIGDAELAALQPNAVSADKLHELVMAGWQHAIGGVFDFSLISAYAQFSLPAAGEEEQDEMPCITLATSSPHAITVGRAFSALEALETGLGRKGLAVIEQALSRFGFPFTPGGAYELARMLYWMGEEDERLALDEAGDSEEAADLPTRQGLFGHLPEWAYSGGEGIPSASDGRLAEAAGLFADTPAGRLLASLAALNALSHADTLFMADPMDCGYESIVMAPPICCNWTDGDTTIAEIFDDHFQSCCETGECAEYAGRIVIEPSVKGISESLDLIRHTGEVLMALDRAIIEVQKLEINLECPQLD